MFVSIFHLRIGEICEEVSNFDSQFVRVVYHCSYFGDKGSMTLSCGHDLGWKLFAFPQYHSEFQKGHSQGDHCNAYEFGADHELQEFLSGILCEGCFFCFRRGRIQ